MNQDDKRLLETVLMTHGFRSIKDPAVIPVFAQMIENFPGDPHWCYRGIIGECEPAKRRDMYESLRPHFINFKPKTLEQYETEIVMEANRMISHRVMRVEGSRPGAIQIGDNSYALTNADEGDMAIKLICKKCTKIGLFVGATVVEAVKKARKKGWIKEHLSDAEICPKCPAVREKMGHA